MKRSLVIGISGFVGRHLAGRLAEEGRQVVGFDQQPLDDFDVRIGDLLDTTQIEQALLEVKPDVIFHLAGVLKSQAPEQFYTAHVLGTASLFEAIVKTGQRPRVCVASSSAVYGAGRGARPISENFQPRPVTHYAVSKLAQEWVAMRYHWAFGLPVICVRMFNLLGPGLSPQMACSDFARQIALAEQKGQPATLSTGSLSARRDFVDVRDAARAYCLLAERGRPGQVYNLASGRATLLQDCVDFLRGQARFPIAWRLDPARVQRDDVPVQVGSSARLYRQTGWKAEIPLEQSLTDLLNDWRRKVQMELR